MAGEMTMAGRRPGWEAVLLRSDLLKAFIATLVVALASFAGGLERLDGGGDNDSLLRLVEVRDLLAGQGWFDLHQYRMGVEGALPMHWSRLVDAPIAAIVMLGTALTGSQAAGEIAAQFIWPLGLYALALYALLRIGRMMAGEEVVMPLAVIGAVTLQQTGIFAPGALDHHNIQLVLMLAMVFFLLRAGQDSRAAWPAGICAVLMLAVGMETAPYVAAGGLFIVGWFLLKGDEARDATIGFGAAFALASAAVFVSTVSPADWAMTYCDAFSLPQFSVGVVGGVGLSVVALSRSFSGGMVRRSLSLAMLGAATGLLLLVFFPQCLGDPYAGLDPVLQTLWLSAVSEAQPLWKVLSSTPHEVAGYYATTLIALLVAGMRMWRKGFRREDILIVVMLLVAMLVAAWQVRGTRFSAPLACVPLAIWVAGWRHRALVEPGTASSLRLVGAWLVSFSMVWALAGDAWSMLMPQKSGAQVAGGSCDASADYALLADLPDDRVLAVSNLGAPILRFTSHHVLAGPYHRNVQGNLTVIETFTGAADEAAGRVRENGIGIVAVCAGNPETRFLAGRAPNGFLAGLVSGNIPAWLQIVPESAGKPLELYRVLPVHP